MSICNVRDCGSDHKVWKVSNDNESPPFYQDFYLCDRHLNLDERVQKVHQALVQGRLTDQLSNHVVHNGWHLEKVITTWKKEDNPHWKCSECGTTEKIWIVVNPDPSEEEDVEDGCSNEETTRFYCDRDLPRYDLRKDPKIRAWNSNEGISTLEATWTEEPRVDDSEGKTPSSKKRSLSQKGTRHASAKKKKIKE